MLIAIFMAVTRIAIPAIGTLISVILYASMPLVIRCIGIAILLACVGVRLNLGFVGAITTALANGIGYLGRTAISAIGWVLRHAIALVPACYTFVRKTLISNGMEKLSASVWATVATILFVVVLI